MIDVDDPDRHDDEAGAQVEAAREEAVEVGLLDLDLALRRSTSDRVLDLELRVEAEALGEVVADEQHEPAQVDDRRAVRGRVQRQLAVAADGGAGDRRRAAERVLDRRLAGQAVAGMSRSVGSSMTGPGPGAARGRRGGGGAVRRGSWRGGGRGRRAARLRAGRRRRWRAPVPSRGAASPN